MKKAFKIGMIILTVTVICLLLVGCNFLSDLMKKVDQQNEQNQPVKETQALGTPVLHVEGNVIYWGAVAGADLYRVKYTNRQTGEPSERLVYQARIDVSTLELAAGSYLFVVRAECTTDDYLDGVFTPEEEGVIITVNSAVSLDDVTLSVYRVDDSTVLCTWSEAVGAETYHVQVGDTVVDTAAVYALVPADATRDFDVTLTVTGKAGYPYEGMSVTGNYKALTADKANSVTYDKTDSELRFSTIINPTKVMLDGNVLNISVSGQLVLSADLLRSLSVGAHYFVATTTTPLPATHRYVLYIKDTRPLAFVNGVGVAVTEMDYTLGSKGLTAYYLLFANTITSVSFGNVVLDGGQCEIYADYLVVQRDFVSAFDEGDYTLEVGYTDSLGAAAVASLQVHFSKPAALRYDAASASDCVITVPDNRYGVLGGGISSADYTITNGGTKLTIRAAYLAGLAAGEYEYLLTGPVAIPMTLEVYNSAKAPYDVVLTYDDDSVNAYGHYKCDCGKDRHYYSLKNGVQDKVTNVALTGNSVNLGELNKSAMYEFKVYCATNDKSTSYTIKPNSTATTYMGTRFGFEGRNPDCYIGSVAEFAEVVRYLSYAGSVNYDKGAYGVSEMSVYIGNDVMPKSGDLDSALSTLLSEARKDFSSPFDCSISAAGNAFDTDTRMGVLSVSVTFGSPIAKTHVNDISSDSYADKRNLLTANVTPSRTTYIEGVSVTEDVGNVQELADLPMGVRPVFLGGDDATNAAKAAWQAALNVCKTFIRDEMTTTQKLQTMYDYLSRYVTYDYYALVWYEVDSNRRAMEQNIYVQWHNAAVAENQWNGFSTEERKAINEVVNYRMASQLAAKNAETIGSAFWTSWHQAFVEFEANTMSSLRDYARQEVVSRNYSGTSLEDDVENMCAQTTYSATIEVLETMTASGAFDAYGALVGNVAVCDGIADAYRLLCLVEGIPCLKVSGIGTNSSGNSEAHAWNKVYVGGCWYCVDATWSKAAGCVSHRYFMVPDGTLVSDHREQIDNIDAIGVLALATEYNYYENTVIAGTNLYAANLSEFSSKMKTLYNAGERTIEIFIAARPSKKSFEDVLSDTVSSLPHIGSISYTYVYNNGYAVVQF